jgi:ubiquitin fusion degradation protein 1
LRILETRPDNAVSIIECDMDVDFAPPVGYTEPAKPKDKPKTINKVVKLYDFK